MSKTEELVFERRAEDNKYLHRDFHASINNAIDYVGMNYGEEGVREYIRKYVFSRFEKMTLPELYAYFTAVYEAEEASDAVELSLTEDSLFVRIKYSPGIKYLTENNEKISEWYYLCDTCLFECLAEKCGFSFELDHIDKKTCAASFSFGKEKK